MAPKPTRHAGPCQGGGSDQAVEHGNPGDVKPVGEGVSEMRIPYGPGYRVYYITRGPVIVVLLCGGDKSSQPQDIDRAKAIAAQWEE